MQPVVYKYTSTKEYIDAFPCAYRQWRADSHCNTIHGYGTSISASLNGFSLFGNYICAASIFRLFFGLPNTPISGVHYLM